MKYEISKESKCAVIGYGSWGTAIVKILQENETKVGWYVSNQSVREGIETDSLNPKYLSTAELKVDRLDIFNDINHIEQYDVVIFATPSAFLIELLNGLTVSIEDKFIISAIKGIVKDESGNFVTIAEYFHDHYNIPYSQIGILTGPCHAEEVAMERLSYLNMVCTNENNAMLLANKFSTSFIKMNTLSDIYGTEYSTVLKNIYALAVGICKGLNYGDNFIAVLITNAAREIKRFLDESYPFDRDINTSAYLGDLLVTSYSQFSRNRSFGYMIGQGYSILSAKRELNMIAEGYYGTSCIQEINKIKRIEMPIADSVYNILYKNASAKKEIRLLSEKLK